MVPCSDIYAYRADIPVVAGTASTGMMQGGTIIGYMGNDFKFSSLPMGDYKLLAQPRSMMFAGSVASDTAYEKTWYGPGNSWETATVISVSPGSIAEVNITLETSIIPAKTSNAADPAPESSSTTATAAPGGDVVTATAGASNSIPALAGAGESATPDVS
jgi:hypothetical protein